MSGPSSGSQQSEPHFGAFTHMSGFPIITAQAAEEFWGRYGPEGSVQGGRPLISTHRVQTAPLAGAVPNEQGRRLLARVQTAPTLVPIGPKYSRGHPDCTNCSTYMQRPKYFCFNPECEKHEWACPSKFHCCFCRLDASGPGKDNHHHTGDCPRLERLHGGYGLRKSLVRGN